MLLTNELSYFEQMTKGQKFRTPKNKVKKNKGVGKKTIKRNELPLRSGDGRWT